MAKPTTQKTRRKPKPAKAAQKGKAMDKKIIALVYDFDGTLSPKPMQEYTFFPKIGENPKAFWQEVNRLAAKHEAEGLITYMHLMYKKAKERGIEIRREELVELGRDVELFPGVEEWFDKINDYVKVQTGGQIAIRHYMISSGLKEIIEGTRIYKNFHNVFASEYFFEAYDLPYPKRVITDTSKTQYLFRINKGIEELSKSINSHMPEDKRPIPFSNMIYYGDGETDVPSMAVTRKSGGHAIAVYPPRSERKQCVDLFKAGRVDYFAPADYRENSALYNRSCLLIDKIIADIRVADERRKLDKTLK